MRSSVRRGVARASLALVASGCLLSPPRVAAQEEVVRIWPGAAPGSESWTHQEIETVRPGPDGTTSVSYSQVVTPTLTVYRPSAERANGTAIVVAPGGGFMSLSWDYEGTDVAEWLAARGVTAFVLKYRLQPPGGPTIGEFLSAIREDFGRGVRLVDAARSYAVADGRQSIAYIRANATRWGISPERIGIVGFSAGAALAMGVALDPVPANRPSFAAPIYGFMDDTPVPPDAPPLFIAASQADLLVPAEQSVRIFQRWTAAKAPAELHLFAKGPHGFGARKLGLPVDHWMEMYERWLGAQGLLTPPSR